MFKLEMLQCYAQNELISNLMPATGLKIVGTGHVYHGVASSLLFKTVWWRLGIEVMSFWSFGVGIWSHSCLIIKVSSCWSVCGHLWCIFSLMMHQMFSIGASYMHQFSTRTLLLWSHAVVIAAVYGFALSCLGMFILTVNWPIRILTD